MLLPWAPGHGRLWYHQDSNSFFCCATPKPPANISCRCLSDLQSRFYSGIFSKESLFMSMPHAISIGLKHGILTWPNVMHLHFKLICFWICLNMCLGSPSCRLEYKALVDWPLSWQSCNIYSYNFEWNVFLMVAIQHWGSKAAANHDAPTTMLHRT